MKYETLLTTEREGCLIVTLNRPAQRNALNGTMLNELHQVLDRAEQRSPYRIIVLQGTQDIFCTGLDLDDAVHMSSILDRGMISHWTTQYMSLLKRLAASPKVIVSKITGEVVAGGVGIAAASDFIIANNTAKFKLSEALWGLLPAMVTPYLIRRVGFQKAYTMTLSCRTIDAKEAHTIYLIDELTEQVDDAIKELVRRISRVDEGMIARLKDYFRKAWIITEHIEATAIATTSQSLMDPIVKQNFKRFVEKHEVPWEKHS